MKAGWKTTEFWVTLASVALTSLSLFGYITPEDYSGTNQAAQNIVMCVFSAINSALYIHSRLNLKRMERMLDKPQ